MLERCTPAVPAEVSVAAACDIVSALEAHIAPAGVTVHLVAALGLLVRHSTCRVGATPLLSVPRPSRYLIRSVFALLSCLASRSALAVLSR